MANNTTKAASAEHKEQPATAEMKMNALLEKGKKKGKLTAKELVDALEDIEQDLGELLGELDLDADLGDENLLIDEDDSEEEKGDEE